jgi:hypothetical protein
VAIPQAGLAASAGFGSLLGIRHALEPDHLAAVSTLITGERSSAKAAWLGACWGLGHTLTLFAAGAVLVVFRAEMPLFASGVRIRKRRPDVNWFRRACDLSGRLGTSRRSDAFREERQNPFRAVGLARPLIVGARTGRECTPLSSWPRSRRW